MEIVGRFCPAVFVCVVVDFVDNVESVGACCIDIGSTGGPEGSVVGIVEGVSRGLGSRCGLGGFVGDDIVAAMWRSEGGR